MSLIPRYLTISFLILFFVIPFGPASARNSGRVPVVRSIHKIQPVEKGAGPQSSAAVDPDAIKAFRASSVKSKRAALHLAAVSRSVLKKISAVSAIVMDAESGRVIYAKAPDRPRQPASTIKVLTGLVALERLDEGDTVAVSRRAARMPRSKIYLDPRKKYQAGDLINAVLLASANDASVALAEKIAGSEQRFAELMTRKARELGARNTICKTASGLTVRGQQSTARDLVVIFNEAMDHEDFAARVKQLKAMTSEGQLLSNHNKALWKIFGAEGGKTGYTYAAKQTYVGKFRRGDDSLLVAIMGSKTMWNDVRRLVEYGFARKRRPVLARSLSGAGTDLSKAERPDLKVLSGRKNLPGCYMFTKTDSTHLANKENLLLPAVPRPAASSRDNCDFSGPRPPFPALSIEVPPQAKSCFLCPVPSL